MRAIRSNCVLWGIGFLSIAVTGCSEGIDRFHVIQSYETLSKVPRDSSLIEVQKAAGDQGIFQYRFYDDDGAERLGVCFRLRHQGNQAFYHFANDRLIRITKRGTILTRPHKDKLGQWSGKLVPEAPRNRAERMLKLPDLEQQEVVEFARKYHGPRFVGPLVFAAGVVFLLDPIGGLIRESESNKSVERMVSEEAQCFAEFERRYDPFKFKLGMPLDAIESLFGEPQSRRKLSDGRIVLTYALSRRFSPKLHVVFDDDTTVEVYGGDFSIRWKFDEESNVASDSSPPNHVRRVHS